jgi:CelD/BcsL family acetyltransferase involved in cellulose biosynthesis
MITTAADNALARELNPLKDPRWSEFVARHKHSSVFHTASWLEALRRTYAYEPVALTTSPTSTPLQNGLVFCSISSWLTGRRWVSLPFSDHCAPLTDDGTLQPELVAMLDSFLKSERLRYIEVRPVESSERDALNFNDRLQAGLTYWLHQIDLRPDLGTIFGNCHKDSTQRKVRRAQRENLVYEEGRSEKLIADFYHLLILTRRRHGLPPQPRKWFQNLADCFGSDLKIRVANHGGSPVASILTIRHKDTMVYKYGCSDAAHNNLGGMHLLFWTAIKEAKHDGLRTFDLGRSDIRNEGLIVFKDRWGSTRSMLRYATLTAGARPKTSQLAGDWKERISGHVFSHLPERVLSLAGNLLYKHIG